MIFTTQDWTDNPSPTGWGVDDYMIVCSIRRDGIVHDCRLLMSVNFDLRHPENREHVEDHIRQTGFDTLGTIESVSVEKLNAR